METSYERSGRESSNLRRSLLLLSLLFVLDLVPVLAFVVIVCIEIINTVQYAGVYLQDTVKYLFCRSSRARYTPHADTAAFGQTTTAHTTPIQHVYVHEALTQAKRIKGSRNGVRTCKDDNDDATKYEPQHEDDSGL